MSPFVTKLLFAGCFISCISLSMCSPHGHYTPPKLTPLTDLFPHLTFNSSYNEFFGGPNIRRFNNGSQINLALTKYSGNAVLYLWFHTKKRWICNISWVFGTGSGFVSQKDYYYGFFSAAIKLPPDYTAGVVVAFYVSSHWSSSTWFEFEWQA